MGKEVSLEPGNITQNPATSVLRILFQQYKFTDNEIDANLRVFPAQTIETDANNYVYE